jgi:hypothetical protein
MARRYRRDLIGHFVRTQQRTEQPCTHACCRGYRVHPANYPVILPRRTLRRAKDEDLARHFNKVSAGSSPADRWAEAQLLAEMQRRDDADRRQRQRREAIAATRAAGQMEREAEAERIRREAEARTQGYLVTAQGRARGVSDAEILTGRQDVFIRYATPEAKAYFAENPRPTGAYLRFGRDTRVPYSDRPARRRRRALVGR